MTRSIAPRPGLQGPARRKGRPRQADFRAAAIRDTKVIAPIVLAVVLLTLIVLLRALIAPLFLLATVVLSYLATIGVSRCSCSATASGRTWSTPCWR